MSTAFDSSVWTGRRDAGEHGDTARLFERVRPYDAGSNVKGAPVLIGFACDEGVRRNQGRVGAAHAPRALRRALAGLPAHRLGECFDAGDIVCAGEDLEGAQAALSEQVHRVLAAGARPIVLGGGHEVAWGTYGGLRGWLDEQAGSSSRAANSDAADARKLLVVNFDAHFDLRTARPGNSGTPFDQIARDCEARGVALTYACFGVSELANTAALFARANEIGAHYVIDLDMQERHLGERLAELDGLIAQADDIYLTIDLDVLPASVVPGVSAPAAFGVPLAVVEAMVMRIRASPKLRAADIAEYNPEYDQDTRSARAAARLVYRLL
ncbi:formimidoylglutamase [Trinickia dinghuensis]|uniref:Formimidoylglutamase n=1 Tax=Trinickia dinghuensis TaxID=2291023 RepID=A0A3D8K1R7_9BURK|nr:formimidoylglutamase [Trinickia dinghuensis]RDU98531.1 formimidoylglutamase [Trinickia dinghuensis]